MAALANWSSEWCQTWLTPSRRAGRLTDRVGPRWRSISITWTEVNPTYSSQTCSSCGYVAKANRKSQARFVCGSCGHTIHADVNAARNLETGRSSFDRTARLTKANSLRATVYRHLERMKTRDRVIPAKVRGNPYYGLHCATLDLSSARIRSPDLVADVSAG